LIHQIHAHEDEDHDHHSPRPDEHDADNHDAADGFCLSSTGKVEVPSPGVAMMPDWLEVPSLSALVIAERFAPHSGLSPPGIAPPELIHHWLFAFRTFLTVLPDCSGRLTCPSVDRFSSLLPVSAPGSRFVKSA
jgi:hypothetical protein